MKKIPYNIKIVKLSRLKIQKIKKFKINKKIILLKIKFKKKTIRLKNDKIDLKLNPNLLIESKMYKKVNNTLIIFKVKIL